MRKGIKINVKPQSDVKPAPVDTVKNMVESGNTQPDQMPDKSHSSTTIKEIPIQPKEDKTSDDKARDDKIREDKTREDKAREDKAREDKTNDEKTRDEKIKKKPGRPRKDENKIDIVKIDYLGVVDKPVEKDDIVRMVYTQDPSFFKKIFALFKAYRVENFKMIFYPRKVIMCSVSDNVSIIIEIKAEYLTLYYCHHPIMLTFSTENFEKGFNSLNKKNKDPYKISFVLRESSYKSSMFIYIQEFQYNSENEFKYDLLEIKEDNFAEPCIDAFDYPIEFTIDGSHFKDRVKDVAGFTSTLTIRKVGLEPLHLTFKNSKDMTGDCSYPDPEKIGLKSTIGPDDIFYVDILIDYIKKFSTSMIGDKVQISCDMVHNMLFSTNLIKTHGDYLCRLKLSIQVGTVIVESKK